MGSRIRSNADHIYECFFEIGIPLNAAESPFILQKYPESYDIRETLKCVPQFAYPCQYKIDTVTHFSFVLTNIDSKWTFGFCRHAPNTDTCIVMLSLLPWHITFFKILNQCAELLTKKASYLYRFLDSLYTSEVPTPGLEFSVTYFGDSQIYEFSAPCPDHTKIPNIPEDRCLTEYFNAIDVNNMITIFANMLNERRILMTSRKLSRLSACVQAANALIYPMHWQHIFIPVLPKHLLDYLSAPMPFLIGVPTSTMSRVKPSDLGDIVILDADENKIESPFDDVSLLPTDVVQSLKKSLRNPQTMLGDGVARSFLRALVMLIGGYREALHFTHGKKITFNFDAFVGTRQSSIQPFLEKMLQLQIFRQFIEERLEILNDGEGFSDEFEYEVNLYEDRGTQSKFKSQYKDWATAMRKEGGAILKSVNPAVKSAYKQVKKQGKRAYKDLRSKIQNNQHNTGNYNTHDNKYPSGDGASSEPSSPVMSNKLRNSIKKSVSGTVIGKTDKTVTYVRDRRSQDNGNNSNLMNDQKSDQKNSLTLNGLTLNVSSSTSSLSHSFTNRLAPEASPELSDVDSEFSNKSQDHDTMSFNRIEIDLMEELKDILNKRPLIDDLFDNDLISSDNDVNLGSNCVPISTLNDTNGASTQLLMPIPPPRVHLTRGTKAKPPLMPKPALREQKCSEINNIDKDAPLIELESSPEDNSMNGDVIFDPLFEKKRSSPSDSLKRPLLINQSNGANNWIISNNALPNNNNNPFVSSNFNMSNNTLNNSFSHANGPYISSGQSFHSQCAQWTNTQNQLTSALPMPSLSLTNTNHSQRPLPQPTHTTGLGIDSLSDIMKWSSRISNNSHALQCPSPGAGPVIEQQKLPLNVSSSELDSVVTPNHSSNPFKPQWQQFE